METNLEPPNPTATTTTFTTATTSMTTTNADHFSDDDEEDLLFIDDNSNCSTPYVSAPSSPGRHFPPSLPSLGFFYSAPASPMHYLSTSSALAPTISDASSNASFEFEFSARFDSPAPEIGASTMSTADELFLNGQIRPMKLSAHLQRPQSLAPLIDGDEGDDDDDKENDVVFHRSRDSRLRDRSMRRRTRSLSPLRSTAPFDWFENSGDAVSKSPATKERENENENDAGDRKAEERENETTPSESASSSRCSSAGRSSKRWVFLKDFLRSKSEGRSNNKFWHNINISFSPAKDKKTVNINATPFRKKSPAQSPAPATGGKSATAKRRSAHEMHYTANRAQAEEMRKKTFLPYRQGLLGCLGFNSKSYGAINGFARALNPVSSR